MEMIVNRFRQAAKFGQLMELPLHVKLVMMDSTQTTKLVLNVQTFVLLVPLILHVGLV